MSIKSIKTDRQTEELYTRNLKTNKNLPSSITLSESTASNKQVIQCHLYDKGVNKNQQLTYGQAHHTSKQRNYTRKKERRIRSSFLFGN